MNQQAELLKDVIYWHCLKNLNSLTMSYIQIKKNVSSMVAGQTPTQKRTDQIPEMKAGVGDAILERDLI